MLAYPVSKKPIDYSKPVFMQPKLDGVRCLRQFEPHNYQHNGGVVKAYSRTGKEWKNIDHILKELKPFFQKHPNVVLDGELYNHDFKNDFEQIISMVRKTKPTDEDRYISAQNVHFHCYDVISESFIVNKVNYEKRRNFIVQNLPIRDCINGVFTQLVSSEEKAKQFHEHSLELGYEGSIVRINEKSYGNVSS